MFTFSTSRSLLEFGTKPYCSLTQEPLYKNVDGVDFRLLEDLAAARSDVKTQEILYCCQIGSIHRFAEAVVPSAGLVRGWEPSLESVFLHF